MAKILRVIDEEAMIEKAFKEGCEHGYNKAMAELEKHSEEYDFNKQENLARFDKKIEELRKKYE